MAAPSPVIQEGLMTFGAEYRTPPLQLAGITAGVFSGSPGKTSVKFPAASVAVGNVSDAEAVVNPGYTPRNFFHSWPAKKNSLPFRWIYGMGPPRSHP